MSDKHFKLTPREAFDRCMLMSVIGCYDRKPGALVNRMPKDIRDALAELKSSDIANDRVFDRRPA